MLLKNGCNFVIGYGLDIAASKTVRTFYLRFALTPTPLPRERDLFFEDEYVVLTNVAVAINNFVWLFRVFSLEK